jgi:threonine efflux protein
MDAHTVSVLFTVWIMLAIAMAAPGPNLVAVASTALGSGRQAGFAVVSGVTAASLIWALTSSFGAAAVFTIFPAALFALKLAGGLYLLFIGARSLLAAWRGKPGAIRPEHRKLSMVSSFLRGFGVCMLNPKAALFWSSISVFIVSSGAKIPVILQFCMATGITAVTVYGIYALLFSSRPAHGLYQRAIRWFEAAFGIFFCAVGGRILFSR